MKPKILIIEIIILIIALIIGGYYFIAKSGLHSTKSSNNSASSDIEELQSDLEDEEENLSKLVSNYRNKKDQPTVTIFVNGMNKAVYDTVYPAFKAQKVEGMMLLSESDFPGESGCITKSQFEKMVAAGWRYSFYYNNNGEKSFTKYIRTMSSKFEELGYKMPDTLYYDDTKMKNSDLEVAIAYGITNIITAENEKVTDVSMKASEDDVWSLGMINWTDDSFDEYLNYAVKLDGSMAVQIKLSDSDCKKSKITSFLKDLKENAKICTLEDAKSFRQKMYKSMLKKSDSIEEDIVKSEQTISDLEKQIAALE